MTEEELLLNPNQQEETICKQYIQDLTVSLNFSRGETTSLISLAPPRLPPSSTVIPGCSAYGEPRTNSPYYFEKITSGRRRCPSDADRDGKCNQRNLAENRLLLPDAGHGKKGLDAYLKADLMDENNTWVLRRIAHCYRLLKEPESALHYYRRLEQLTPDDLTFSLILPLLPGIDQYAEALNYYSRWIC